jgi:Ca2+-binding EF-hand superfamily protein
VKQYDKVFTLFDIHNSGLVSKSDISFYLLKIKDIVSAQLDFSLIEDFDTFQTDHREIDVKYFKDMIEIIVR